MKNQAYSVLIITLLSLIFAPISYAAGDIRYISSQKAKLLAAPNFKAMQITALSKGLAVTLIEKKGIWLKVSHAELGTGWVSKFLTKKRPPTNRVTLLPSDQKVALRDVRRRTSAITTAAAARGLAASSRGDKTNTIADFAAVAYMESFNYSDEAIEAFERDITGSQP